MEHTTLYNGLSMPMVGFGVFQIADGSATQTVVEEAIVTDYRLIDTAQGLRHELCRYLAASSQW